MTVLVLRWRDTQRLKVRGKEEQDKIFKRFYGVSIWEVLEGSCSCHRWKIKFLMNFFSCSSLFGSLRCEQRRKKCYSSHCHKKVVEKREVNQKKISRTNSLFGKGREKWHEVTWGHFLSSSVSVFLPRDEEEEFSVSPFERFSRVIIIIGEEYSLLFFSSYDCKRHEKVDSLHCLCERDLFEWIEKKS